jgi:hypothetical protein
MSNFDLLRFFSYGGDCSTLWAKFNSSRLKKNGKHNWHPIPELGLYWYFFKLLVWD